MKYLIVHSIGTDEGQIVGNAIIEEEAITQGVLQSLRQELTEEVKRQYPKINLSPPGQVMFLNIIELD